MFYVMFFSLRMLFISVNQPYNLASWNNVVMSGLVLLDAIWICWINYRNICRIVVLSLAALLNSWFIVEIQRASAFSIGITLVDVHLNWLNQFHFLNLQTVPFTILIGCMVFPSSFLDVIGMSLSTVSLLSQLDSKILCQQNALLKLMI